MASAKLKNLVWKEGKYYIARCLNVEVSSFGDTKKKALENLDEALELYFEDDQSPKMMKIECPEIVSIMLEYI